MVVRISGQPLSTLALLSVSHCPSVLTLLLLLFSSYWFSLVHFVQQALHFSLTSPSFLFSSRSSCPSSIRRGVDPSPGQVSGADGESEGEESWICLQTALRGLPAEVINKPFFFSYSVKFNHTDPCHIHIRHV